MQGILCQGSEETEFRPKYRLTTKICESQILVSVSFKGKGISAENFVFLCSLDCKLSVLEKVYVKPLPNVAAGQCFSLAPCQHCKKGYTVHPSLGALQILPSAPGDAFPQWYNEVTKCLENIAKCVDDTILWAKDIAGAFTKICEYLPLLGKNGIIHNPLKLKFV